MAEEQMDELMKIFPVKLREILSQVTWYREDLEEIRIRIQRPVQFVTSQASFYLDPREKRLMTQAKGGLALGEEDLREMLTYVCEYSRYAYARQMRQGFLALDGGIRLGLCGQYNGRGRRTDRPWNIPCTFPSAFLMRRIGMRGVDRAMAHRGGDIFTYTDPGGTWHGKDYFFAGSGTGSIRPPDLSGAGIDRRKI